MLSDPEGVADSRPEAENDTVGDGLPTAGDTDNAELRDARTVADGEGHCDALCDAAVLRVADRDRSELLVASALSSAESEGPADRVGSADTVALNDAADADAPALLLLLSVALSDATDALSSGLKDDVPEELAESDASESVACDDAVGVPEAAALSVSAEALGRLEQEGDVVKDELDVADRELRLLAVATSDAAAL